LKNFLENLRNSYININITNKLKNPLALIDSFYPNLNPLQDNCLDNISRWEMMMREVMTHVNTMAVWAALLYSRSPPKNLSQLTARVVVRPEVTLPEIILNKVILP
jgi:hypothetical protein